MKTMQEQTLLKIALISTIVGLMFLFIYSQTIDLKMVENIDQAKVNEPVKIEGTIEQITTTDKAVFLKLSGYQWNTFDVILFPEEQLSLNQGDKVEIYGKIASYNGQKEIIADEVIKTSTAITENYSR